MFATVLFVIMGNKFRRLSLNPAFACEYSWCGEREQTEGQLEQSVQNFEKKRKTNLMSLHAAKKMRKAINWMVSTSKERMIYDKILKRPVRFRLTFITLTLPAKQVHSDTEIKDSCLALFLQWLRDSKKVKKYIWKAEIQKNGNIHFHITTDKYIHHTLVRNHWNKLVNKLGYVDRYYEKFGNMSPPSTEIKSVKKIRNIASYLAAYMSGTKRSKGKKGNQDYNKRVIEGRLFGISSYLSGLQSLVLHGAGQEFDGILKYLKRVKKKAIEGDFNCVYILENITFQTIIKRLSDIYGCKFLFDLGFSKEDVPILLWSEVV